MTEIQLLINRLENGHLDDFFREKLSCRDVKAYAKRAVNVLNGFSGNFQEHSCSLFSSPGRTELGGNHTDHQCGNVLAAAVNADMICAAAKTDRAAINLVSEGFGSICVDLGNTEPCVHEQGTPESLVRGMAAWFKNKGFPISGVNAYIASDVPAGSGISSSAAFEVLLGTVFSAFFADGKLNSGDVAKAGQFAENAYFGKPCGLMDQTACAYGGIVAVDFKNPSEPAVNEIKYDFAEKGYALCIVSTGGSHDDLTADYAAITEEMAAVSKLFGKNYLSELTQKQIMDNSQTVRNNLGDRAFLRAVNYFEEDKRALLMANALRNDDFEEYLRLVNRSGQGSFMYLQNISPVGDGRNQSVAVALQAADLSLSGHGGFRVHGGGFAGTIQAYVPFEMLDKFVDDMEKVLFEGCCTVLDVRLSGAIEFPV